MSRKPSRVGQVWEEKLKTNDPDPWIYLVISDKHNKFKLLILYGGDPYEGNRSGNVTFAKPFWFEGKLSRQIA